MSDLVEIYQDNIKTIFTRVGKLLDNLTNQSSEKTENTILEAENGIKEAERIVNIYTIFFFYYSIYNSISQYKQFYIFCLKKNFSFI
jgi:hypothetical protein